MIRAAELSLETSKLSAFVRRDFLTAWSYRFTFFSEAIGLIAQAVVFSFVGRMVDPTVLPSYGGTRASYLTFVAVGIAFTQFLQVGLGRMVSAIRTEQLMGTLESLLLTPMRQTTLLLGSVTYDLLYVPVHTIAFLGVVGVGFGLGFHASGALPAIAILLLFVPFVWGIGIASAAGVMTFRKGSGLFGWFGYALTLMSGAYFPTSLLPDWLQGAARMNPISVALTASRKALIGGAGWAELAPSLGLLAVAAVVAIAFGTAALQLSLRRERRLGTIGMY
ncbi:MAG: hypothetical protein GEU71_16455 [Actinobacteria bacterium]|nr:hypothetical protein [Actinomycetota bacterium]